MEEKVLPKLKIKVKHAACHKEKKLVCLCLKKDTVRNSSNILIDQTPMPTLHDCLDQVFLQMIITTNKLLF